MRKLVMINWISVDGFFAGPHGEIDWMIRAPEVDRALREPPPGESAPQSSSGTMLLGNVTYTLFENSWPPLLRDPNAPQTLRDMAAEVTRMTKLVFSHARPDVSWENSQLFHGHLIEEVRKLKQAEGTDILIFGSGSIVQQLARENLIDEYLMIVTPVVLGNGKLLFKDVGKLNLHLVQARQFDSGNLLLRYRSTSR
jgi:dihydrofolate reductase